MLVPSRFSSLAVLPFLLLAACGDGATSGADPLVDAGPERLDAVADARPDAEAARDGSSADDAQSGPFDPDAARTDASLGDASTLPDASRDAGLLRDAAPPASDASATTPYRPFPQHVPYATGSIRPSHRTQAQLDARVRALYQEWKARYLVGVAGASPRQAYVHYNKEGSASSNTAIVSCSEGHGYGMLLAAYMAGADPAAREDFDALARFYDAHRSAIEGTLMGWQQVKQGSQVVNNPNGGTDSATDGDLDVAYAFFVAHDQWGSGGTFDYRAKGLAMARGIDRALLGAGDKHLRLGDWVRESDPKYGPTTRSSDFLLGHLKVFHAADASLGFSQAFTTTLAIANGQLTASSGGAAPTGLLPDFFTKGATGWKPVAPSFLEGAHDGDYHYNACRVPWRLATYELTTGDRALHTGLENLNTFIKGATNGNPRGVKAGYRVSSGTPGQSYASYEDLSFTAPFLVSAAIDARHQAWMNSLWDAVAEGFPTANDVYYGNSIRLLTVLVASGNWWVPTP
jgi:hypothetical protein